MSDKYSLNAFAHGLLRETLEWIARGTSSKAYRSSTLRESLFPKNQKVASLKFGLTSLKVSTEFHDCL